VGVGGLVVRVGGEGGVLAAMEVPLDPPAAAGADGGVVEFVVDEGGDGFVGEAGGGQAVCVEVLVLETGSVCCETQ